MKKMRDLIEKAAAIDALSEMHCKSDEEGYVWIIRSDAWRKIEALPPAQPEIIRCKDCRYWKRQTNYQGSPLSFGFCESDDMWQSLYGETYEVAHIDTNDNHYCGYAKRRTDARQT